MSYLPSTVFRYGDQEPVVNTVILFRLGGWGVALKRSRQGLWYAAGMLGFEQPMEWEYVLDMIEGEEVFLLGPRHEAVDSLRRVS